MTLEAASFFWEGKNMEDLSFALCFVALMALVGFLAWLVGKL